MWCFMGQGLTLLLTCSSAMRAWPLFPSSRRGPNMTAPAAAIISAFQPGGETRGKERGRAPSFDTSFSRAIDKTLILWLPVTVRDAWKGSLYFEWSWAQLKFRGSFIEKGEENRCGKETSSACSSSQQQNSSATCPFIKGQPFKIKWQ